MRDILRELKNPWLTGTLIAMAILIVLLFNIKITVA